MGAPEPGAEEQQHRRGGSIEGPQLHRYLSHSLGFALERVSASVDTNSSSKGPLLRFRQREVEPLPLVITLLFNPFDEAPKARFIAAWGNAPGDRYTRIIKG